MVGLFNVLVDILWKFTVYWYAGNFMCKLIRYLQTVVIYASTYVLVAMSLDRYLAVCRPLHYLKKETRYMMIIIVWSCSLIFSIPSLVFNHIKSVSITNSNNINADYKESSFTTDLPLNRVFKHTFSLNSSNVNMFNLTNVLLDTPSLYLDNYSYQCWISLPYDWLWKPYFTIIMALVYIIPAFIMIIFYGIIVLKIWRRSKDFKPYSVNSNKTVNYFESSNTSPSSRLPSFKNVLSYGFKYSPSFYTKNLKGKNSKLFYYDKKKRDQSGDIKKTFNKATIKKIAKPLPLNREGNFFWTPIHALQTSIRPFLPMTYNVNLNDKNACLIFDNKHTQNVYRANCINANNNSIINHHKKLQKKYIGNGNIKRSSNIVTPNKTYSNNITLKKTNSLTAPLLIQKSSEEIANISKYNLLPPSNDVFSKTNQRYSFYNLKFRKSFQDKDRNSLKNKTSNPKLMVNSVGLIPRAKIKSIKITFAIVTIFIICWSPYFIFDFLDVYNMINDDNPRKRALTMFIQSLSPLNSAANPLIYFGFNTKWWRKVKKAWSSRGSTKKECIPKVYVKNSESSLAHRSNVLS
ncbi:unnamed protein product [Gordionus sp. m RMFG-2023]